MKFDKSLFIGVDESRLEPSQWKRIDSLTSKRIHLTKDSPDIAKNIADSDCLVVPFGFPVTKEAIDSAKKLKYIGIFATAYGKVDFTYAKSKGIVVTNIPGYSTESVAEFVIASIFERIRMLEKGKTQAREGNFSFDGFTATEIKGKIFGVIGLGRIGRRVAEIASALGADARYWSKNRKTEAEKAIKYQDADSLIKEAAFLSLNFSQTNETEGFLNEARIQSIKPGAVVVSTVPMETVDIGALAKRLSKNDITFILDHSDEMTKEDLGQLQKYENCIVYPPIAFLSEEAKAALKEIFTRNMEKFAEGSPTNTVG